MLPQIKIYRENDGTGDLIAKLEDGRYVYLTEFREASPYVEWVEGFTEDPISVLVWQSGPDA